MSRLAILIVLAVGFAPAISAQTELGAYVDYLHLKQTNTNFAGLGGRLGLPIFPHVKLEGEISYDFNQVFTETFTSTSTITVSRSNLRLLHGLGGPKIELGFGNFHPFLTVKGGFFNARFDPRPATLNTFVSSVQNLRSQDLSGILYPGVGLEGHFGPLGLRLDVGDEIYFNSGSHNNLRVAFGPYIRF